jgi:hypothetical protein
MANPIIEAARLHFRADERREIDVPEWGVVLYAAPVTLADKRKLHNRYKDGGLQEMYVHALIEKAQLPDGKPAFTLEDKRDLLNKVAPEVVERVAEAILKAATPEDAEKN